MMTHRNTPSQSTGISPAGALFGRPMRDHLPDAPRGLRPEWKAIMGAREQALAKRHLRNDPSQTRRELSPLAVGDMVSIQNQHGNKAKKWGNTGRVAEVLPNRQYHVVVDGSRHVTLRNRRFLRKIHPLCREPQAPPTPAQTPSPALLPGLSHRGDHTERSSGHDHKPPSGDMVPPSTAEVTPALIKTPDLPAPAMQPAQQQHTLTTATPQPLRRSNRSTKGIAPTKLDL